MELQTSIKTKILDKNDNEIEFIMISETNFEKLELLQKVGGFSDSVNQLNFTLFTRSLVAGSAVYFMLSLRI